MKVFAVGVGALQILLLGGMAASAGSADPYRITVKEKLACTTDAMRLCSDTYPDEHMLLQCMKTNRSSLSSICLAAFDAGLKRRRLN